MRARPKEILWYRAQVNADLDGPKRAHYDVACFCGECAALPVYEDYQLFECGQEESDAADLCCECCERSESELIADFIIGVARDFHRVQTIEDEFIGSHTDVSIEDLSKF